MKRTNKEEVQPAQSVIELYNGRDCKRLPTGLLLSTPSGSIKRQVFIGHTENNLLCILLTYRIGKAHTNFQT